MLVVCCSNWILRKVDDETRQGTYSITNQIPPSGTEVATLTFSQKQPNQWNSIPLNSTLTLKNGRLRSADHGNTSAATATCRANFLNHDRYIDSIFKFQFELSHISSFRCRVFLIKKHEEALFITRTRCTTNTKPIQFSPIRFVRLSRSSMTI